MIILLNLSKNQNVIEKSLKNNNEQIVALFMDVIEISPLNYEVFSA